MPAGEQTTPERLSRCIMSWQSGETHLVLLSKVCKEEKVGRLGTLELSRISGTLLSPWGFWMILLILCHDHTVIRLQEQLGPPEPLASPCHICVKAASMNQSKPVVGSVTAVAKMLSFKEVFGFRCRDTDTAQLTTMYMLTLAFSEDSSYPRFSSSDKDLHFSPAALATSATFLLSGLSICMQGKVRKQETNFLSQSCQE